MTQSTETINEKSFNLSNLSIVIPVYNGGENFRRCLSSLKEFASEEVEVTVVADGDTDNSRNLVTEFGYQLLVNDTSKGPAYARNRGAKQAKGKLVFFMDADVTINEHTIPRIISFFNDNPKIDAVIGSYDDTPFAPNFLSQYKNLFHHYTHQKSSQTASTFWGACGIVRKDVFLKVGGFDESYRLPSVEDIELGYRLQQAGYSIALCKDIQIKHLKEWRTVSLLKAEIFQRAIPWTVLLLKYKQIINDLNLGLSSRLSVILVYLLLFSTLLMWLWPPSIFVTVLSLLLLLIINFDVYYFFLKKKNVFFSLLVIPWHLLYYLYGGFGFAFGWVLYQWRKLTNQPSVVINEQD